MIIKGVACQSSVSYSFPVWLFSSKNHDAHHASFFLQLCLVELSDFCTSFELTSDKRVHSQKESPIGIKVFNVGNSFSQILSVLRFTICQGSKESQTSSSELSIMLCRLYLRGEVYFWSAWSRLLQKKCCFLLTEKLWNSRSFKPSTTKLVSLWRARHKTSRFCYQLMMWN